MANRRSRGKEQKERDPVLVAEGRAIARALAEKGYDRSDLASKFEVTEAAVGYWIRGDVAVPYAKRKELVEFLGMEPSALDLAIQVIQSSESADKLAEASYTLATELATVDLPMELRLMVKEVLKAYGAFSRENSR